MRFKADEASVKWVTTNSGLAETVSSWGDCLTIDTEFVRTNTYYPMPGLYQVGSGPEVYLLDPLTITEWQPFVDVLVDPGVVKIMHACQEDSELIYYHLGISSVGVFDTQFAHAFVSDEFSLSYVNLVERRLGLTLDQHQTRSDWLARPLSEKQVAYAVEDVIYLEALYLQLMDELERQGKLAWFESDMAERAAYAPQEPLEYYRNVKKAWHLDDGELARLQQLCAWREATARRENIPRNRVVWDEHLYTFASEPELSREQITATLPRIVADRYAGEILTALASESEEIPVPLPRPLSSKQGALVKQMRERGLAAARQHQMAPELICRKKDLEACVRHYAQFKQLPERFQDWREALVGPQFMEVLKTGVSR